MAINKQPVYPARIKHPRAVLKDGIAPRKPITQNPITLYDGTSNEYGALITRIHIQHLGINAATTVRFYSKLRSGTTYDLVLEAETSNNNDADNVANAYQVIELPPIHPNNGWPDNRGLRIEPGESIHVALGDAVATGLIVFAEVGEY